MNHIEILKSGVENWNAWRRENPNVAPDLSGAVMFRADLSDASLNDASLRGAKLIRANLYKADLRDANLINTDLSEADLRNADLSGADLSRANLSGANLFRADLSDAKLTGANLTRAVMFRADLSGTKGIVSASFDPRGWTLVCWLKDNEPWFNAGLCHSFPKVEALAHWASPYYPCPSRGKKYVKAVEFLAGLLIKEETNE